MSGASSYATTSQSNLDPEIVGLRNEIRRNSQDFRSLKTALASDNLAGAQTAFLTLQQDIQTGSKAADGKSPFSAGGQVGKDFDAIGDALKSGNLAAAKKAFQEFRQDMRHAGRAGRTTANAVNSSNTIASTSAPDLSVQASRINVII